MNYYNENNPKAAAWLRVLIEEQQIPPGHVDERSITDVKPDDLAGFIQCHFFAGIGGWSYALRLAGWPEDRPIWTGSCPCQPFSVAGKGMGIFDQRHLWPYFRNLIGQCRPPIVVGEQVASAAGRSWLAGVFADLEALAYCRAGADLCAAGVGAPHIRQRLYWMARRVEHTEGDGREQRRTQPGGRGALARCGDGGLGHPQCQREPGRVERGPGTSGQQMAQQKDGPHPANQSGDGCEDALRLAHNQCAGQQGRVRGGADEKRQALDRHAGCHCPACGLVHADVERLTREPFRLLGGAGQSHWASFDLLYCLDRKVRRIEPSSFPLAHGFPARVALLQGFGNAIVPQVAAEFIIAATQALKIEIANHVKT